MEVPLGAIHLPAERIGAKGELESILAGVAQFAEEAMRWLPETRPLQTGAADAVPVAEIAPAGGDRVLVIDDS